VEFSDGTGANFRLAKGFGVKVSAEGLGKARFIALSPDGRLFVPDLVNYNLSHEGKISILEDFDEETGKFNTKRTYLSGLRGPNSVAFYRDAEGKDWIYIALTAHLIRYSYRAGDTKPSGELEIVMKFPNTQTPGETSVVWHITRTLLFHNDRLYIAIGSGCNSCEQPAGEMRGMIISIDPDGKNPRVYADGLRNSVGIEWAEGNLYATANGADHLGPDRPDELMFKIEEGEHYGWPYCYEVDGVFYQETPDRWTRGPESCESVPRSFAAFDPHSAPLGLRYFKNVHEALKESFLVALHGSFDPKIGTGYKIVRVSKNGGQAVFMDGFQDEDGERVGRPVDFLQHDENSFFFTDDHAGRLYWVYALDYRGE
jgi:glucose/arabinose dehydrogenase